MFFPWSFEEILFFHDPPTKFIYILIFYQNSNIFRNHLTKFAYFPGFFHEINFLQSFNKNCLFHNSLIKLVSSFHNSSTKFMYFHNFFCQNLSIFLDYLTKFMYLRRSFDQNRIYSRFFNKIHIFSRFFDMRYPPPLIFWWDCFFSQSFNENCLYYTIDWWKSCFSPQSFNENLVFIVILLKNCIFFCDPLKKFAQFGANCTHVFVVLHLLPLPTLLLH